MGETADLRNPNAGTFGLNDFISQGDNETTLRRILLTMVPTVDMRDFQRRFRVDETATSLQIGERISDLRWTVPRGEAWRPRAVLILNGDNASHSFVVKITLSRGTVGNSVFFNIARTAVPSGEGKTLWPLSIEKQVGNSDFNSNLDYVLENGDSFVLEDLTDAVIAATLRAQFYYELVPQPPQIRAQGIVGVATIV